MVVDLQLYMLLSNFAGYDGQTWQIEIIEISDAALFRFRMKRIAETVYANLQVKTSSDEKERHTIYATAYFCILLFFLNSFTAWSVA